MKIETKWIHPDEPCHGLREEPRVMPMPDGSRQLRWIQMVFVVRDDTIACYTTDFGPAANYKTVTPLMMPSFGENTVAQLMEHADKNRVDTYWNERAKAQMAESTLIRDHIERLDMVKEYVRRNPRTVKELQ